MLEGKWVWIWNWRRCDDGDVARVAARLKAAGCAGAIIKAHDGARWFDQGQPWREIGRALKAQGLRVAAWAYIYGADWPGEAQLAIETVQYGEADAYVLNVESELKNHPDVAEALAGRIREAVGPNYPLFYSTFAIARYHREFPYAAFQRHCTGALPLVYWNAFRWPVEQALGWTYEDYAALGEPPGRVFPVGGLYREGYVPYPAREEVLRFAAQATSAGSPGISFWSYEHMDEAMWQAVRDIPWPAAEDDETAALRAQVAALQRQLDEVGRQNADFAGRLGRGSDLAYQLRKVLLGEG
jgi:hypothetical protein